MGTFTLSKSNLSSILASLSVEDKTWAIKFLADHLMQSQKKARKTQMTNAVWKNYTVSPEVMAMTVANRKNVSDNDDEELASLLEEKYR